MKRAYPYCHIGTNTTYVVIANSQEEADIAMCNEYRKQAGYNQEKFAEMARLTCGEKPITVKKAKIGIAEGKYVEIKGGK